MNKNKDSGKRNAGFSLVVVLFICFFTPVLFAENVHAQIQSLSIQENIIFIDKEVIVIGESINFEIITKPENIVEIISDTGSFRLFGDANGKGIFIPQHTGSYLIRVLDFNTRVEIVSKEFIVKNYFNQEISPKKNYITTDKKSYFPGEKVIITFDDSLRVENISALKIIAPNNVFDYLGVPESLIIFIPDSSGIYSAQIILSNGEFYIVDFEVGDGFSLIINDIISNRKIIVKDSKKRLITEKINILEKNNLNENSDNKISESELISGKIYDFDVEIKGSNVNRIKLDNLEFESVLEIGLDDLNEKRYEVNGRKSLKSFAINIPHNFSNGTATSVAKGTELYKCANWDFELQSCFGSWEKYMNIVPGKEYSILLYPGDPGFAELGVASINTNQSTYLPGSVAEIIMVVLDNQGYLVSDADVSLVVTAPNNSSYSFSTSLGDIEEVSKGIYHAYFYNTNELGYYSLVVDAQGLNVNSTLSSYFVVDDDYEFDIFRNTPSSIDPFRGPFSSSIVLYPRIDVNSFSFTEVLPRKFSVYDAGGASVTQDADYIYLTWNNLVSGSSVTYVANSPLITPMLWELGPSFVNYREETYYEARSWYLAIDPISYYYDPNRNVLTGWTTGTGSTFAEIDDGVRYNTVPDTNNYIRQTAGTNSPSQFGIPNISQQEIDNLTLWVYTGTGSNAVYTFELRQGGTTRCTNSRTVNSPTQWYNCTWAGVTGDLSNISMYFSGVTKSGGGANQPATVFATYVEARIGNVRPNVTLSYPLNNSMIYSSYVDFNFTPRDLENSLLTNCSLYGNFSGSWSSVYTRTNVQNGSVSNISRTLSDGSYLWNVQCFDSGGKGAFAPLNYSVVVNSVAPNITSEAINNTLINQSEHIRLNATIIDTLGISSALATFRYPNGTLKNFSLSNTGTEYYYVFFDTNLTGIYNVTLIWANDTYNQANSKNITLSFTVTASPPTPFNLISPANNTESNNLLPTFNWLQTQESNFKNYTLLIDKDMNFGSPDFVYTSTSITNTTINANFALDANSVYYWRVIAYDIFDSSRNSINDFSYITDTISPSVILNNPDNASFTAVQSVQFNFTPNDANTLDVCVLWTNFSGTFQANNTLTSVVKAQVNSINSSISNQGRFVWNVRCNDSSGNAAFASQNFTITADYSGPIIQLLYPQNNTYENNTNIIIFQANSTDFFSSSDSCKLIINGVVEGISDVSDSVSFNFTKFLTNAQYNWSVNCTDILGNEASSFTYNLTLEVVDNDPPLITLNYPYSEQFIGTQNVVFNYTPEDATGLENCSIFVDGLFEDVDYGVENFVPNYFNVFGLSEGEHNWTVQCFDNSTEFNSYTAPVIYFNIDVTEPIVTLNMPNNNSFSTSPVSFNFTPFDLFLDECYLYGNFTGSWSQDAVNISPISGQPNYFVKSLSDGDYLWNVLCRDLANTQRFSDNNYTVKVDSSPPLYQDIIVSPASPASYAAGQAYNFNITWTDNFDVDVVLFENNFSGTFQNYTVSGIGNVYNYTITNLVPGNYYYRWFANDSINNKNQTNSFTYILQRASSQIQVLLNGSNLNFSVAQGSYVNISGLLTAPSGLGIQVYLNSELIANVNSPTQNITFFDIPGEYNVTAVFVGNQNYSSASDTKFVIVEDINVPVVYLVSPSNNSLISSGGVSFQYNVTDYSDILNCSIFVNGAFADVNYSVEKNILQTFIVDESQGNYTWRVECFDEYDNLGVSGTYNFEAIDTDTITINVSTQSYYVERGVSAIVTTNTKDIFGLPLIADITSDIIRGNTSRIWWNTAWSKRKQIIMNETGGINRTNQVAVVNITGLSNNITSCQNELRVIYQSTSSSYEVPFTVYSGDNSNWCRIAFRANISANAVNYRNYFVYYNNSGASNPGYNLNFDNYINYFATVAAADEGTPTNVANIVGSNDATFATMAVSGGGAASQAAHGRGFVPSLLSNEITKVEARYRYQVPTSTTTWELRSSVNDGASYSTFLTGTTTIAKSTSSWLDLTSSYAALNWSEVNTTRLQGRVSKGGGGGGSTIYLFWVELNITYREQTNISQTSVGDLEEFISRDSGTTDAFGEFTWSWLTTNYSYANYSAVAFAEKDTYHSATNYYLFELIPDSTPPNITLLYPPNFEEFGAGMFNFSYAPYDVNLKNCSLFVENGTGFALEGFHANPLNNLTNTFNAIYRGVGLFEWNVLCYDTEGNSGFAPYNFTLNVSGPDITLTSDDIWFGSESRIEGLNVNVYANISNVGLSDANESFYVRFYFGDPDVDGVQINGDVFVQNLSKNEVVTLNVSHLLVSGPNNIFVVVDYYNDINESIKNNNKANNTLFIEMYQYYYGQITKNMILGNYMNQSLVDYLNVSEINGNIYFSDVDSSFSFLDLRPLTRNINDAPTGNDFSELDGLFGTSLYPDSIVQVWGGGSDNPVMIESFNISGYQIDNVPVVYSTNTTNFRTGILWDSADDNSTNLQFDITDAEDVVFVTKINKGAQGAYGVYDYEIKIPAMLREYKGAQSKVVFYTEIY